MGELGDRGFPKSAFRLREKMIRCRCGNPLDKKWLLVLSDPLATVTTSIPLCSSCGPVLFSQLADGGWLTQPLLGETLKLATEENARPTAREALRDQTSVVRGRIAKVLKDCANWHAPELKTMRYVDYFALDTSVHKVCFTCAEKITDLIEAAEAEKRPF